MYSSPENWARAEQVERRIKGMTEREELFLVFGVFRVAIRF